MTDGTRRHTVALLSDAPESVRPRLEPLGRVVELGVERLGEPEEREVLEGADCAVVAAAPDPALTAVRRLHAAAPTLQVILVVPAEQRRQVERSLLFAPGLGEVWLAAPEELTAEHLERARRVTEQRRRYRVTRRRLEEDFSTVEPQRGRRALISDAYLAALLQVLPHPVISIDEGDRVLSWNPAAEQIFAVVGAEAVGRHLLDVLTPVDRPELELALAEGGRAIHHGEAVFHRPGQEPRVMEVTVVPVSAAGHRVRSVVLHDITESRRVQEELRRQAEELETQRAQLQAQTGELEELNRQLQQRSGELETALAARGRFYAAMSHELRTPMNAIIGYSSLLAEGIYGPLNPQQLEAVGKSMRAAEHLLELVNDVLDLAKIEAGRIELLEEQVYLPAMLSELLDTVRPLAEERGSRLELDEGEGKHTVVTDPRRVRQILLNLLSNAIKFGEGRPIQVGWRTLGDGGVRIDVNDRGRGIAPEDVPRIFDEFVQLETRQEGGTGLGLPISRRLAEVLGGSLEVHSVPGEGSTFCLTLPATLPPEGSEGRRA